MPVRPNLDTPLAIGLAPLLAAQTLWVRRRILRLPEPDGPREGTEGSGPLRRLLVTGDSSAAGVGVDHQDQALALPLARHLARDHSVRWNLCARNGATTADARALLESVADRRFDLAMVIFGVNDSKNLRLERHYRRDLTALIDQLRDHHGVRHMFLSGLPRVQDFPLLPYPLRGILALRTQRFDQALREVADQAGCHYLPLTSRLDRTGMAIDGFHPGAPIYATWAEQAADAIRPYLSE